MQTTAGGQLLVSATPVKPIFTLGEGGHICSQGTVQGRALTPLPFTARVKAMLLSGSSALSYQGAMLEHAEDTSCQTIH